MFRSNRPLWLVTAASTALLLLFGWSAAADQDSVIHVPVGRAPSIDGTIHEAEWDDAVQVPLRGGEGLFLKRAGAHLYVAIRGASGGIASVCLGTADRIRVLHASTALITASYEWTDGSWRLVHGFRGPRQASGESFGRGERLSDEYKSAQLTQYGWTANVVEAGEATDMEYQIELPSEVELPQFVSVAFLQARARTRLAYAPATLADASLDPDLIEGSAQDGLEFDPSSWHEIRFE